MEIKWNRRFSDQLDLLAWDNVCKMFETEQFSNSLENLAIISGTDLFSNISYILLNDKLEELGIPKYSLVTILGRDIADKVADRGFIRHLGPSTVAVIFREPYSTSPKILTTFADEFVNAKFVNLVSALMGVYPNNRIRNVVFNSKVHYLEVLSGTKFVRVTDGEVDYTVEVYIEEEDETETVHFIFVNAKDGQVLLSEGMCSELSLTPVKPMIVPTLKLHLETTS